MTCTFGEENESAHNKRALDRTQRIAISKLKKQNILNPCLNTISVRLRFAKYVRDEHIRTIWCPLLNILEQKAARNGGFFDRLDFWPVSCL
jgi:hypothetical protein